MEKFRWKRVIITIIIGTVLITPIFAKIMVTSRLSNKEYLGVDKEIVLKDLGEPKKGDSNNFVYGNKKNYEIFIFGKDSKCIAHVQHLQGEYFKDIYKKLTKRKGQAYKVGKNIGYKDGTIIESNEETREFEVKEYSDEFMKIMGN